ncbi:ABC transporter permease [Clostridium luticellarii]|jgi:oligopeptide transport system permease protein|uniref:Oligopeptide transport system permease protein OppB n=1 Tax=Clostridium luticellarii TaxID=1691940 RepID=A0A2T0BRX8_9CLOT|nr:ABC transporter permease [Clostridium luticellarii]MCI1943648.1 ABC transporter permease [Clostridium luticellarii]MCI1969615.1 ABC transporter permease [Clostridium luticellarii]MCI1996591.1 ABC transporter permease [Clostridium luticellarii]MCI2038771.1 ABC transporter permease [Clostridium luticellarii]PRR86648.1 Oligopeptide transport system permease protein OppB [Clostridium luticellarii]
MSKYILKRLFYSIITIWIVISITFLLMHLIPGGPFDDEKKLPPQIKAKLEEKFGLDKPLGTQYTTYLGDIIHGDLGPSMRYEGKTVNEVVFNSFPVSAKIGLLSIAFALIFGLFMGIIAALHQGKWPDSAAMLISTIGVTIPNFVMATFFIYFFAVKLGWFPAVGLDSPSSYVLPSVALGAYSMSFIARLSRSSLLEVIRQDYIKVEKAKGLSQNVIIYKHALKNSLIPIVTYIGPLFAGILTGSFVIETLFGIPGLGRDFVQSIYNRDYTTILGITIFYSSFLVLCNLIVDILYVIIDPRIKLEA